MISKQKSTKSSLTAFLLLFTHSSTTSAFLPPISPHTPIPTQLHLTPNPTNPPSSSPSLTTTRSQFLLGSTSLLLLPLLPTPPAAALVKGNAPPPKFKSEERKCRNVEECQEYAEKQEALRLQREREEEAENGPSKSVVVVGGSGGGGTKYLELEAGRGEGVKVGDVVEIYFKVLKLGKRSYDGLSGEGTVVFSRGYGLEDDEKAIGDHSFTFTVGEESVIQALNDAIPGMQVGALRRISILPQKGWNKNTKQCDGGPGGSGAGGDLKTDYVVVPTATMVEQEACFDKTKRPFPGTYAQERRMAQRFDQSLIMEVRLVNVLSGGNGVVGAV